MSTFSSTLDLPNLTNLTGFDTGIPTNSSNATHFLFKLLLIALCVFGLFYCFYSLVQKKEGDTSERLK
jgi:hypothetical protein